MDVDVQRFIRAVLAARPDHERLGLFMAGFDRYSDNQFRNYAVPDDGAAPILAQVADLVAGFERRGRVPRLEYVPSRAPLVEPALLDAGFSVENRPPFMACAPERVADLPWPDGIILLDCVDDTDLYDSAVVAHEAYGEAEPPASHDVGRLRATVERGGVVALARDTATGTPVGSGLVTGPRDGVAELAAVGVRAGYRRRGIAAALASFLGRAAAARGVRTIWLEPAGPSAERIYSRAGFIVAGAKLNISRRAPG